jgi:hypothetical protein
MPLLALTIVELIVAVVIIGILIAAALTWWEKRDKGASPPAAPSGYPSPEPGKVRGTWTGPGKHARATSEVYTFAAEIQTLSGTTILEPRRAVTVQFSLEFDPKERPEITAVNPNGVQLGSTPLWTGTTEAAGTIIVEVRVPRREEGASSDQTIMRIHADEVVSGKLTYRQTHQVTIVPSGQ